jgi:amidase
VTTTLQTPHDVTSASAVALAAAIRAGHVSAREVVDAHLDRIDLVNPRLNAVVQVTAERARVEARAADAARASGEPLGPLHGVPITIKDAFDLRGVVSTGGTLGRAGFVPEQDATAVARLRAAGAIVLGKTNVPELSLAFETDNLVYGRTNNPYDLTRTPGGSSGGEAAIIAAGGSPLGLGSDAAGSIRVPAHFCGIAGLKPTHGRVPRTGAFPPPAGLIADFWQVGPLARRVEDLIAALPILAGPDGRDPSVVPVPVRDPAAATVSDLRIAVHTDNGVLTPTPETIESVRDAADSLTQAGALVEEVFPTGIERGFDLATRLFAADGGAGVGMLLHMAGTTQPSRLLTQLGEILHGSPLSPAEFGGLLVEWDVFRATMLGFMERYDAILCPVNASPALLHGTTLNAEHLPGFSYTMAYNVLGWPAVVVRAGTTPAGLPIGVQVVARPWREDVALALALRIEAAAGSTFRQDYWSRTDASRDPALQ